MKLNKLAQIKNIKNQDLKLTNSFGRNFRGKITVRHKERGHKKAYRKVHWDSYWKNNLLLFFEYDAKRKGFLSRVIGFDEKSHNNAKMFYKMSIDQDKILGNLNQNFRKQLKFLEVGDVISNISMTENSKPIFARSAGTNAVLLRKQSIKKDYVTIKLPSGKVRLVHRDAFANVGQVNLSLLKTKPLVKAGQSRWLGKRPSVRGVAMNPVDHPHGGGEGKTSGGRPSVTPWGRLTKGVKTRKNKRTNNLVSTKYTSSI